jgi:site-specific DNA recombinase
LNELIRRFERHCVGIHSVNEGRVDLATAAGRMQVGIYEVFAQFYREHIVENVQMGMRQAAEAGRWLNRAPTGYLMREAMLVPGDLAPIVRRIFELRAAGVSLPEIEAQVGIGYSTVRHIVGNRVYLGEVRLRDEWFPGSHEPLVSPELFEAATPAHLPGRRRGRDLLSGRVRCGLCGRVATVDYNERGQELYKCKHRGRGCGQPGRSARGLCRAALLGLTELKEDLELQQAIRDELDGPFDAEDHGRREAEREAALTSLRQKQRKLLDLHYEDRISAEALGAEEARIAAQIRSLDADAASAAAAAREREERFNEVVDVLTTADVEELWEAATAEERRVLVEDLVEAVSMFPDHLEVKVGGAPPLLIELSEVGLRDPGTRSSVSEDRLET